MCKICKIALILDVVAIDNDKEVVIRECRNLLSQCCRFYDIAITHCQPESRRQVAEMIGPIRDLHFINYLRYMVNDKVNYVQMSALLSIAKIIPNEAEEIAFRKVEGEYIAINQ